MAFRNYRVEWGAPNDPKARAGLKGAEALALLNRLQAEGVPEMVLITSTGARIEGHHHAVSALETAKFDDS